MDSRITRDFWRRSLVSGGGIWRLGRIFQKAEAGGEIVVGAIGGSVTEAYASSDPLEKSYGGLATQWFRERFPGAKVRFVNAGVGATGSVIGVHRAGRELLAHRPDLIFVEFSVNDPVSRMAAE